MLYSKREIKDVSSESDSDDTENEKRRVKKPKSILTKDNTLPHLSASRRHDVLMKDQWVRQAEPKRVQCNACMKWIALRTEDNRQYELHNWEIHRNKCPRITGMQNKRKATTKPLKNELQVSYCECVWNCHLMCNILQSTGMRPLSAFFGNAAVSRTDQNDSSLQSRAANTTKYVTIKVKSVSVLRE